MNSYFKKAGNDILLDTPYMEAYIPMYYFKNNVFATDGGNMVKTLGIFYMGFFENGKLKEMKTTAISSWVDLYSNDYEVRNIDIPHYKEPVQCKVIKYYKGNKVMIGSVIQNVDNAVSFLDFIIGGKLPLSIPYDKTLYIWYKNQMINNTFFGVPSLILELILSVCYRCQEDPTKKFCEIIGKNDSTVSQYDYKCVSIRQICQYSTTFQSLTFEDIDAMITSSLNRTKKHVPEIETPIEKIIKM